ncbi:hypothetical protein UY3_02157 [Chelonia mydas]|uniref:SRCR domain-containing protein n=1 Tax=Chelonia mydas TaxID=8469 RepID=M7CI23_CHEMY|nr:hypothetical protein UY3_02157 [Chelonia mydas]
MILTEPEGIIDNNKDALSCNPVLYLSEGADILRLVDGGSPCAGRVEVKHQDQWGMVCDDDETERQYHSVVCKQLVCGSPVATSEALIFGEHSGLTWLTEVICHGNESALWDCKHGGWELKSCPYAAGVLCSGKKSAIQLPQSKMMCHITPRLAGGDSVCSGRVEVRHGEETWSTVCDSNFSLNTASVICNQLNCGTAISILGGAQFGEGNGTVWTETFQCVMYCPRTSYVNQTCGPANTVNIICSRHTGFRLVNGSTECSGRVEIQVHGAWGALCDSHWDLAIANTLCNQLDCGFAILAPAEGYFGEENGSGWTDSLHYNSFEPHFGHGPVTTLEASQCPHDNDASVICSGTTIATFKALRTVAVQG